MEAPSNELLGRLAGWDAEPGVLTVCIDIEPGDRGDGWRTVLRRGLESAVSGAPRERAKGVEAAADRARSRVLNGPPPARAVLGFLETAERPEREDVWLGAQVSLPHPLVVAGRRPVLRPLVQLLDDGGPFGVVALSAERVRIWEWRIGSVREVVHWLWDVDKDDWRERKGPRQRDPARSQTPSSSGRDLHDRRVAVHRERFLENLGEHARNYLRRFSEWRELLLFGEEVHARAFRDGLGQVPLEVEHTSHSVIAAEEAGEISERIAALVPERNRRREIALVEKIRDAAFLDKPKGALGLQETIDAALQGRAEHVVFDARLDLQAAWVDAKLLVGARNGDSEPHPVERVIEATINHGGSVTPVEDEAADELAAHEGMGALLRF